MTFIGNKKRPLCHIIAESKNNLIVITYEDQSRGNSYRIRRNGMSKLETKTDLEADQAQEKEERFQGSVKWFSEKRGYGFIQVGDDEVFIHRSTLLSFGIQKIQNEDIVTISLVNSERGLIVEKLYGVERPPIPVELMADTPEDDEVMATVKFFNNHKGYGFIIAENESQHRVLNSTQYS